VREAALMHAIMLALAERGHAVFRANVGLFFTKDGRPVHAGLPVGFSDLFGHRPDGQAWYLEIKTDTGRVRPQQAAFVEAMRQSGARAGIARSIADAITIIED
jgi:hypothetical protein